MRRTKFLKRYPRYCGECNAYGIVWKEDHEGILEDYACPCCLAQERCPRCFTKTMVTRPAKWGHPYDWETCTVCHWRGDDDYGDQYTLPRAHTCWCTKEAE